MANSEIPGQRSHRGKEILGRVRRSLGDRGERSARRNPRVPHHVGAARALRFGLSGELYALAALVNGVVFLIFLVMYLLMRYRVVQFGYREG